MSARFPKCARRGRSAASPRNTPICSSRRARPYECRATIRATAVRERAPNARDNGTGSSRPAAGVRGCLGAGPAPGGGELANLQTALQERINCALNILGALLWILAERLRVLHWFFAER